MAEKHHHGRDDPTVSHDDQDFTDAEDSDLAAGLSALSQLSVTLDLDVLLTKVADYAVRAIPGADGAGLTLLESDRANTVVTSKPFVKQVDDIQYSINEGPCVSAAAQGQTMRSGSLGGDPRWPRFGPRVGRLGVHSVLSLPLIAPTGVVGAMNVYAFDKNAFDQRAEDIGELFAVPAAVAVHNAHILAQAVRLATRLQGALQTRAVIDQAIGILRSRGGGSTDDAFERLRRRSQTEHIKLGAVAAAIVDEAVRRAEARHTQ